MTLRATRLITISNKLGLHARAASKLVNTASGFESTVILRRDDREADAKSIMSVMMLAASCGVELEISATGADAEQAVASIESLVLEKFGEPE